MRKYLSFSLLSRTDPDGFTTRQRKSENQHHILNDNLMKNTSCSRRIFFFNLINQFLTHNYMLQMIQNINQVKTNNCFSHFQLCRVFYVECPIGKVMRVEKVIFPVFYIHFFKIVKLPTESYFLRQYKF